MAKTGAAIKIIEKMVGDDVELKQLIADARVSAIRKRSWPIWWAQDSQRLLV